MTSTSGHDHGHAHDHGPGEDPDQVLRGLDAQAWDDLYAASERRWSGQPNQALVVEAEGLTPATALDVGCGEGADTVWLARQGWRVTGLDVSQVAIDRARAAAEAAGVQAEWIVAGLADVDAPEEGYDLVSAFYPALPARPEGVSLIALLGSVAPGGTLLVVAHADPDPGAMRSHGVDPDELLSLEQVEAALERSSRWEITVRERRERHVAGGSGAGHTHDEVLRATRLSD